MTTNLKQKTISGGIWSAIHKFASVILGFVSGIVLARLLTPHDYGVIGMLTIFLAISNTFIDGGFGSALIQKKQPTDIDYSTILYWNIGFSIFLYVVLYFLAPLIAQFYDLPITCDVLRVQGIVLIINAARIVQHNQLRKHLEFKKVAIINLSSYVVALLATIFLAWLGWGVWALVAQQLIVGTLCSSLYWITAKWRPVLVFSMKSFKELFSFGGFVLFSNLYNTLCNNIQGLLIGKVYTSSTLGLYSKARGLELNSSQFISSVLDQVSYPVLAASQDNNERMINIMKRITGLSAYFTFPCMLLLILLSHPLFLFLYSERWLASVPYFQLLCLAGIAVCMQNINYNAVAALGKSKVLFKWTFIKRSLGLFVVIGGLWLYGINGLLIGSVFTSWLIYGINAEISSKYVGYGLKQQITDLGPILAVSVTAFLTAYVTSLYITLGVYVNGMVRLFVFISVYILCSIGFRLDAYCDAKETIRVVVKKLLH